MMINIVLLSGGSGKRLWPLSNESRSKQFLKVLKDDQGKPESMVQRVYRQIKNVGIDANIVVATRKNQVDALVSQLGHDVDVVLEPERRDTFPAVVLACSYLALEKKRPLDDVVIVLPVDPYADSGYFETLVKMERLIRDHHANIGLMGIKPAYPSAKFGYIVPQIRGNEVYSLIKRFQEKPDEDCAEKLIEEGALWNGGVFAFTLNYIMSIIQRYGQFNSYAEVEQHYCDFPRISFDYEVLEKESSLAMIEYSGTWADLGTWNTLTEAMDEVCLGKAVIAESCENTHVINELGIPVVVLGAKNMVVAVSPDGILVSDKHQSSYMKPYVDTIVQRPMFEERRWGTYRVLNYVDCADGTSSLTKYMFIRKGQSISYQNHCFRDEIWIIVDGFGDLVLDGVVSQVVRGDITKIFKGEKHALRAISDMCFIEVQLGSKLVEEDIQRFDWLW